MLIEQIIELQWRGPGPPAGISRTSGSLTSLFSHVSRDNSGATQRS